MIVSRTLTLHADGRERTLTLFTLKEKTDESP